MQAGNRACSTLAMEQKAVGCDQQNLERNKQVEQIASQEGYVQPHQLEQEKGVELAAADIGPPQ